MGLRGNRGRRAFALAAIAMPSMFGAATPAHSARAGDAGAEVRAALRAELAGDAGTLAVVPGTSTLAFAGATAADPITGPSADPPTAIAGRFVDRYASAFGVDDPGSELVATSLVDTAAGRAVRFQQEHDGIPVIGAEMAVQLSGAGAVLSATARTADGIDVDVTPAISARAAAASARVAIAKRTAIDVVALAVAPPELGIFDPDLWGRPDPLGARLVWRTSVRTATGDVNRFVLVDAATGAIALEFDQVRAGRQRMVCDQLNVRRNPPPCASPVRSEGQGAIGVADVDQAYDLAGLTYDYYLNVLGRDSVDGNGLPLRSTVRICLPSSTGTSCPYANAYWDDVTLQMYYGEGYASADDVVAHELTHGVTQFTSDLFYYAQSGAINESLSDVFGELVDRSTPDGGPAWAMGEDLPGGALRSMSNPPAFGDPDRMRSALYWLDDDDSGGVHINSGVNNKAASLIADGGTFNGRTVTALGDTKTAWIYYTVQTTMLTSLSQYSDLANMLPQACRNLVGQHGIVTADCDEVTDAVIATEMAQPPPSAALDPPAACTTGGAVKNRIAMSDTQSDDGAWQRSATLPAATPSFEDGTVIGDRTLLLPEWDSTVTATAQLTQPFTVPAGETFLAIEHLYAMEAGWDGGVVEYSADGATWNDLELTLGSANVVNGYNDLTDATAMNTSELAGRDVFSGESLGFVTSRYDLAALAGQTIRLRFRVGSDTNTWVLGWIIDDLSVYSCGALLAPMAPASVTATPGDGQATVSWSPPFDGGAALTGYVVTPIEFATPLAPRHVAAGVTSTTFTGLTNGNQYRFTVAATNAIGTGDAASSGTVTPSALPAAPGTPVAVRGNGSATLTWAAPPGPAPVTGYSIVPTRDGVVQPAIAAATIVPFTVTGLTNGATYTFTVAAVNGAGVGPPSAASNPVVPIAPYTPLQPARLLESRPGLSTVDGVSNGIGLRSAGSVTAVQVAGRANVPFDAVAVALNVTVTDTRDAGYVTVFPCGVAVPNASNLNYTAGTTVPNMVVAKLGLGGQVCFFTRADTHLVVDIGGVFPAGGALNPLVPSRLLESRSGLGTVDGASNAIGLRPAGSVTEVQVAGRAGVPADVAAVVLNVTVTDTQAPGYATVFPCGGDVPTASNLNYGAGATVPNATLTKVSVTGTVCVFTLSPTHLVVDVTGWFPASADVAPLVPARLLDSRPGLPTVDGQFGGLGVRTPGVTTVLQVTGRGGVPAGATAAALNVTVTETQRPGFVTVWPCDSQPPTSSNLNFAVGTTVANAVLAKLGSVGQVCFYSEAPIHLIVDVNGYVTSS